MRAWTPDDVRPTGRTIHVKRACTTCGRLLGDPTDAELDLAVAGVPLPDVTDECGCARLAEIRIRTSKATPGPWKWHGNSDYPTSISLESREWVVLAVRPLERSTDDPAFERLVEYRLDDASDKPLDMDAVAWEQEVRAAAAEEYLADDDDIRTDDRLMMRVPAEGHTAGLALEALHQHVIWQVCPDATDRKDPRVYRADFTQTRSPDAQFIAHARADIDFLLARIDELEQQLAAARAGA